MVEKPDGLLPNFVPLLIKPDPELRRTVASALDQWSRHFGRLNARKLPKSYLRSAMMRICADYRRNKEYFNRRPFGEITRANKLLGRKVEELCQELVALSADRRYLLETRMDRFLKTQKLHELETRLGELAVACRASTKSNRKTGKRAHHHVYHAVTGLTSLWSAVTLRPFPSDAQTAGGRDGDKHKQLVSEDAQHVLDVLQAIDSTLDAQHFSTALTKIMRRPNANLDEDDD